MHSFSLLFIIFFIFSKAISSTPPMPPYNVTLYGDAHLINNAISLTQEHSCPSSSSSSSSANPSGIGRALFMYPIRFRDPITNTSTSIFCHFTFTITPSPMCSFGDGLAFLITSNAVSFSLSNGYLGLPGPALSPQDSFIAVEFDTRYDPSSADINGNHIGVDINSVVSFDSVDVLSRGIDLKSGKRISVWIEYVDAAKLIQVWVSYSLTRPHRPILVSQVDLSKHFKEFMHVGFSASNGPGSVAHIIHHWHFKTYTYVASASSVNVSEGNCVMCSPEDLENSERPVKAKRKAKIGNLVIGLGGLAAFLLSLVGILSIIMFFVMKERRGSYVRDREDGSYIVNRVPTRLSFSEIKSATMGFSRNRIVGTGASATVYKGYLSAGEAVAIKRFDRAGIDCARNPFLNEFAMMVGCLRHKNLVKLQGWCCEGSELVLVYEYLPNGSLDKVLHRNSGSRICLSWKQRLNIVLGIASALWYLHEECERQIIHRDVKSCNIMLDKEFNAKLGDFGLAEVYEHSSMTRAATIPAGTMGYLAPEYVYSGIPTEKTDVYSFGVVILEVATGRRPVEDDGTVLFNWVWKFWEKRNLIKAADSRLKGKFNVAEMERMLMVGLSCVHPNHEKRPIVKEAERMLIGEAPLPILPARKPKVGFQYTTPVDSDALLDPGNMSPGTDSSSWMTPRTNFS